MGRGTQYLSQSSELFEMAQALFKIKVLQSKIIQNIQVVLLVNHLTTYDGKPYTLEASKPPLFG
jgi:hypothetical protein